MSGIFLSFFGGALPTFAVSPSTASVNEGSSVTFTVTTTNVSDGTTLYWSLNTVSGTINTSDFTGAAVTGSFSISSNTGSVALTLANDTTTEGSESFQLQVRTGSTSGTIVATSSTVTIGDTSLSPSTWSINSSTDFSSNSVYNVQDISSGQTFYVYAKTINSKKTLCVMAGRQTGSGSQFHYSNSWWSNKIKINDNATQANIYSNTTTNFASEAFFRVPIAGAFVTSVLDNNNPNAWIEYSGTLSNSNSIGNGAESNIPAGALTYYTKGESSNTSGNWYSLYYSSNGDGSEPGQGSYGYWGFDMRTAYAGGSNSRSRSRFGYTATRELFSGSYYSSSGLGFGAASDDQDGGTGSPGVIASSGYTNARSNAGNSGLDENVYEFSLEFWIIPQNNWQYRIL